LHYVGMGLTGDQELGYKQNKTLNESNSNGVQVYLFEVFKKGEYTYKVMQGSEADHIKRHKRTLR
jgi:5-methylcytosine-specific restriction protein A